ncbi:MAG TPA: hypothetical protein VN732_03860, partial [Solirubrobacterales bacterium]|nr:hypothetical protein [Solirubrobacterales bacterium]
ADPICEIARVVDPEEREAILARALRYPYDAPERPYLLRDGAAVELPDEPDLDGREPLLAYGANAAPEALARKLAALPGSELPVLRAEIEGFDVVYSAHVSPYGSVPATLLESPGTRAPVFVIHPTAEQRALLNASEPNYDMVELDGLGAYRSKHGFLSLDGSPVALAAVRSQGRTLPELDEPAVLERVRAQLAPELDLGTFVHHCVEQGGIKPLPELRRILPPPGR